MRIAKCAWAAALAFALAGSAQAQNFQSAITGVKPSEVQFRKIDTGSAIDGPSLTSMGQSQFNLTSFFRRLNPFGSGGKTVVPRPQYSSAFEPLRPINSTVPRR